VKKKVLLFADFGIDDVYAYLYGALKKEIDIIGIVASYGNVTRDYSLRNAKLLKEITRTFEVPVILGAARPLTGDELEIYPEVHGVEGIGPFSIPVGKSDYIFTFEKIYELIRNNPDVTIVNVGRLTSLAISFINNELVMKSVKEIFVMGGAFRAQGNATPVAEANIYSDFIAANIVNKIAECIKYLPLDVTLMAVLNDKQVESLSRYFPAKLRRFLIEMHKYYSNFYSKKGFVNCSPYHDLLTMWSVVNNEHITYEKKCVEIVLSSSAEGQTIGYNAGNEKCYKHEVATFISYDHFINDVLTTFYQGSMNVNDPDWL
jgi:purine nucleosidase